MPYFGGTNIFGAGVTMTTTDHPRSRQINVYFGLNGIETLDGGARGRTTDVTGILYGNTASALAAAEGNFRALNDGVIRTLVDNYGTSWSYVFLDSFQPRGRIKQSATGIYLRAYRARFLHLA